MAEPDPVTLLGEIEPQVKPDGTISVRATVPVKPFRYVIVIVEVVEEPSFTVAGELAEMLKSRTT